MLKFQFDHCKASKCLRSQVTKSLFDIVHIRQNVVSTKVLFDEMIRLTKCHTTKCCTPFQAKIFFYLPSTVRKTSDRPEFYISNRFAKKVMEKISKLIKKI